MAEDEDKEKKSFWETVPGIITALAALITALVGVYTAIYLGKKPQEPVAPQSAPTPRTESNKARSTPTPNSKASPSPTYPELSELRRQVRLGMTMDEVRAALGEPYHRADDEVISSWFYKGRYKGKVGDLEVHFRRGIVDLIGVPSESQ